MRIISSVLVAAAVLSVASPAFAQGAGTSSSRKPPSTKPAASPLPKPVMSFRAFGAVDFEWMKASQSFSAIGSSVMVGYGGGGEVDNLWKTLFVRGEYVTASSSGERVIDAASATTNGIPITVRLNTFEVAGGWRIRLRKSPKYTPYVGAGFLQTSYSDKSPLETSTESVSESVTGYDIFGGLDMQIAKKLYLMLEAQYRMLPLTAGTTAVPIVSSDPTDLGGFVARVMVGYRLGKK
jgi:hypothetical protein